MKQSNHRVTLTILGPPGSGKGTQAKILAKKFGLSHIELGVWIRELIKKDRRAKANYDQGIPQPDALIAKMLEEKIGKLKNKRLIIDPFPLTKGQVKILDQLVKKYQLAEPTVIYLKTDPRAVLPRMMARGEGREDDTLQTAQKRIELYRKSLQPVLVELKQRKQLLEIDGNPPIPRVTKKLLQKLKTKC